MFMDSNNVLTFVVFLLIYVANHVMLYSVVDTPALYIKSIMTVYYDFHFSAMANLCRPYFKYDNKKLKSYTLVEHIIF